MWEKLLEADRPQMTIWQMLMACWIPKATNTHSEYVILMASPLQQWLQEGVLLLHYTYIFCLVCFLLGNSQRLNFICRRFGTLCLFHIHRRIGIKMEQTECSKTSVFWVIPRRLNFICRRFGTLCSIFIGG